MNQLSIRKNKLQTKKKKKGFTLVELIIVIAIIGILAMIAIPKFGSIRTSANHNADIATAKNIATTVAAGVADNTLSDNQGPLAPDKLLAPDGKTVVDITKNIDGGVKPKDNPTTNTGFTVTVKDGNIEIDYEGSKNKVYPD